MRHDHDELASSVVALQSENRKGIDRARRRVDDCCFGIAVAREHSDHVFVSGCLAWLRMTHRLRLPGTHTHVFEHVLILTRYIFAVMRWYSRKVLNQG